MLTQKRYRYIAFLSLFIGFVVGTILLTTPPARAVVDSDGGGGGDTTSETGLDINATVSRVNRMTLLMDGVYFYDSNTTTDDSNGFTFNAIGTECEASIVYREISTGESGYASWTLKYKNKNETGGECGVENTKTLTEPTNWTARKYVVFAGGSSDGKFISVSPTNNAVFKKGGKYNGDTVYIQQGVEAYSCPLVIVTNSKSTALIPLEKKSKEADVSEQIKTLFDKELGVGDTACGPTDDDKLGIFNQFGLPESYYDAGSEKDHYETTDFGFEGKNVGSATIYVGTIAQVAGIAAEGPLKGGGYEGDEGTDRGEAGDGDGEESSCKVDGIGWIICPVMNFIGKLNDAAFDFLQSFLTIRPALIQDDGTTKAWSSFRDIANVAFVIAFLVIVYSQVTSAGISNYGIKKLLPRIVVAAILVNLSYYICALAVDLSNIVGSSIYSLLKDSIVAGTGSGLTGWEDTMANILKGAAVGIGVILLVIAVLMAPTVLLAFAVVIMILIARQAFVILLIVISPLAFVAYLLPNTESWFKKWWNAFVAVLMVYPIIGVVFGASTLASNIISGVSDGTDSQLLQLIALGILAVPLFAVPSLLKGSLSAAGSVGAKLQGLADKAQSRAGSQFKNRAERYGNRAKAAGINMRNGEGFKRVLGESGSRRRRLLSKPFTVSADNEQKDKYAKVSADAAARDYVAKRASTSPSYARSLAGGRMTPGSKKMAGLVESYAIQAVREEDTKDIKAERSKIDRVPTSTLASGMIDEENRSGAEMAAHAAEIAARGPGAEFQTAIEASRHIKDEGKRQLVQRELLSNMREDHYGVSDEMRGLMGTGSLTSDTTIKDSTGQAPRTTAKGQAFDSIYEASLDDRLERKLSAEKVVSLKSHDMKAANKLIESGNITDGALQEMINKMADAETNPNTAKEIKGETKVMFEKARAEAARRNMVATPSVTTSSSTPSPDTGGSLISGGPDGLR